MIRLGQQQSRTQRTSWFYTEYSVLDCGKLQAVCGYHRRAWLEFSSLSLLLKIPPSLSKSNGSFAEHVCKRKSTALVLPRGNQRVQRRLERDWGGTQIVADVPGMQETWGSILLHHVHQAWLRTTLIPTVKRWRQEDQIRVILGRNNKSQACLVYK